MRDSTYASAILSPEKRRVLSELTAKRKIIKNKYKQAYANRTKLERDSKEIFKPILTSIDDLKPSEKTKKLEKIKKEKLKKEKEEAAKASVHSLDIVQPPSASASVLPSTSHSEPLLAIPSDDDDDDDNTSGNEDNEDIALFDGTTSTPNKIIPLSKKRRLTYDQSTKKGDEKRARVGTVKKPQIASLMSNASGKSSVLTPTSRLTRSQARKLKNLIDESNYTYEVVSDYQDLRNYHKPLNDHAPVNVKKTSDYTGKSKIIKVLWKQLPKHVQNPWLQQRKRVYDLFKDSLKRREERTGNMKIVATPKKRMLKRLNRCDYNLRQLKKKREDEADPDFMDYNESEDEIIDGAGVRPLDYNFIPYNVKNRVIYEYFDDPNELCERLRLLISSRMAGNSNHMQEINSIVEELRELKCIA